MTRAKGAFFISIIKNESRMCTGTKVNDRFYRNVWEHLLVYCAFLNICSGNREFMSHKEHEAIYIRSSQQIYRV